MLKSIWNAVSFMAVVNLLALLFLVGWLVASNRVSGDRVETVRELFSRTIAEEEIADAEAEANAQSELVRQIDAIRSEDPMPPSIHQAHYLTRIRQSEQDRARRIEEEMEQLQGRLTQLSQALIEERNAFRQERKAWEQERKKLREREESAQFQQVVRLLENVPAKQAKAVLQELADTGKLETAVAYLDAMKAFSAAKVLREFKTEEEQALATELLERMKSLGTTSGDDGALNEPADGQPQSG